MFRTCLVTDRKTVKTGKKYLSIIKRSVEAGIDCVVLREKDLGSLELFYLAKKIKSITGDICYFIINGRPDIAAAVNADGAHLTSSSVPIKSVRKLLGKNKIIGISCHSIKDVINAEKQGADYVFLGPIFNTPSKAKYGQPLGPDVIIKTKKRSSIPVIAIGGINTGNIGRVLSVRADGIAVIREVMLAKDPGKCVKEIRRIMHYGF